MNSGSKRRLSLRRAAEALDCTLVYALVPNGSLKDAVNVRACKIAARALARVGHTIKLEAQETGDAGWKRALRLISATGQRPRSVGEAVSDLFAESEDATLLEPEEQDGLLQSWVTHRGDLNQAEQEHILPGAAWARGRRGRKPADILPVDFALTLHTRMFGEVWKWGRAVRTGGISESTPVASSRTWQRCSMMCAIAWRIRRTLRMKPPCGCITG